MWVKNNEEFDFEDDNIWKAIVNFMNDDIREIVHNEAAPCSKRYFIELYIEKDPEFEQVLAEEFSIEWY